MPLRVALFTLPLAACASSSSAADFDQSRRGPVATAQRPVAPPAAPADAAARLLAVHNAYRAQVGAPPLQWDPRLAQGAAAYGPLLARSGQLVHSPRAGRPGISENLWMGTAGAYAPEAMVHQWGAERAMFRPGTFPNVSTTGNWLDVSHYTQMIWRTTSRVGCAIHRGGRWDYLICRYAPSGNRDGIRLP